jgi:hypothetical protein
MIEGVTFKSTERHPPGGYQFLQAEFGQKKPFTGSLDYVTQAVIVQRKANKFLSDKHGLATDYQTVRQEVMDYNIRRCIAHGWTNFLSYTSVPTPSQGQPESEPVGEKKTPVVSSLANAVGGVKKVAAGVGALIDWLGSGGKPVASKLSDTRAGICARCPQNGSGGISEYFTVPAAKLIQLQLEMKNDLKLVTKSDDQLGVCKACLCPLKLKVHAPLEHILAHTSEKIRNDLDQNCWILNLDNENGPRDQSHAE